MAEGRPYVRSDLWWAVNLSALLGWMAVVAPIVLDAGIGIVPLAMLFGLPIALVACWAIGAPILWRLMRRPIAWRAAAGWGAAIAALMSAVSIAFGRYLGWLQSRNPNSWSQIGGGDHIRSIDGILTPYGWRVLAMETGVFILTGVGVALVVRAVIGPGRQDG